jgi:hypothetical protein
MKPTWLGKSSYIPALPNRICVVESINKMLDNLPPQSTVSVGRYRSAVGLPKIKAITRTVPEGLIDPAPPPPPPAA